MIEFLKLFFSKEDSPIGLCSFEFETNSNRINIYETLSNNNWEVVQISEAKKMGKKYTIDQILDFHQ